MSWLVVVNPAAGRPGETAERVEAALGERAIEADIYESAGPVHVTAVVDEAIANGRDRFVAVGGDGTVNAVANRLMEHEWERPPLLGVLPAGTGCDFVRTFGISQRLEDAADHLLGEDRYLVDVGVLDGPWGRRHFVNVATAGLGAAVVRIAGRLPARIGPFAYKLAIWPALVRSPRQRISLKLGEKNYEGPATLAVFANAQFFGGGMNVAPKASMIDGALDVQVFSGPKRQALLLQPRVARGTHLTHRGVRRFSTDRFSLDVDWPWEADGEYLGRGRVEGQVVPGAIAIKV